MLHLLTQFRLRDEVPIKVFQERLRKMTRQLSELGLIDETGPVCRRFSDTIMDTDDERDHAFHFRMVFSDHDQCRAAIEYMYRKQGEGTELHGQLQSMIADPVFTFWEELPSAETPSTADPAF